MKKYLLSIVLTGSMLFASCPPADMAGPPDKTLSKDAWVLKVWVTAKGTRSEGRVSHLYHNGHEVCPSENQTTLPTPLGTLKYVDAPYAWGWHGWKPLRTSGKRFPVLGP